MEFKSVKLKDIIPDPNQPRQFYDEAAMQELVQSIKSDGILQPILLRPSGKKMMIVFGERRYRAADSAGLKEIPAMVREMTDEEALQAQIVENLQRKDVHPMEEAVAFKSLLEVKNWSIEEIAQRVGKSPFYVRQRLKLNSMIEKFRHVFYKNSMTITTALKLSTLSEETQNELYENGVDEMDLQKDNFIYELSHWTLKSYAGSLSEAAFPLDDDTLIKGVGACTTCQFNSAVLNLFPEDDKNAKCNNLKCFASKQERHFDIQMVLAKEDPTVLFVTNGYGVPDKEIKKIASSGIDILPHNTFESIEKPDYPDIDDYRENLADTYYDTEEEMMESFNKEIAVYDKELAEYENKIASGKYKKAFVVAGHKKGSYIYIQVKKDAKKITSTHTDSGTNDVTTEDIDEEISRLKVKEDRAKELDAEKIYGSVRTIFDKSNLFISDKRNWRLTQNEIIGVIVALHEAGSYDFKNWLKKQYGLDSYNLHPKQLKSIQNITEFGMNECLFHFMHDKLQTTYGSHITNGRASILFDITKDYHPTEVNKIVLEQEETANKRIEKVNKRIKELQAKKKELAPKTAKAAK